MERLAVIGVGLIGGSFAAALKARGGVRHVVGVGRSAANLTQARELGVIDATASAADAVRGADFILIATPVGQMEARLAEIAPHLDARAVITDGGSTKVDVVGAARRTLGAKVAQFVPGHPIAGSDKSGASAAMADLFVGRRTVLTPIAENIAHAVNRVREAWQLCGATVVAMSAAEHDAVLGITSHLPHVLAYALMHQVLSAEQRGLLLDNAGSGFRDFTRLAGGQPEMWRDILLSNRTALLAAMDGFDASVAQLRTAIEQGDEAALDRMFNTAREQRDAWLMRFNGNVSQHGAEG
ncbi:MAG: prephenate dehydrogenase/arogenate dehydrogenase family protein [Betaproteobacteria bacterium]|nr:prephenate dehydrogenase/arogenate dehydrogenase family protein [Betaproteobacteria bacterium]